MLLPITANYAPLRRSTPVWPMPRSPVRHFEPVFGVPLPPGDKRGKGALNEHQTPGKRSAVNQHSNLHQNRWPPIFIAIYISATTTSTIMARSILRLSAHLPRRRLHACAGRVEKQPKQLDLPD